MKLVRWIACHLLGCHNWTCAAEQGIKPRWGQSFWSYASMYCRHCGAGSEMNK